MNKSFLRLSIVVLVLAATLTSMTSCNRGYGCPTDFSISVGK
jgi:hypothetical protein